MTNTTFAIWSEIDHAFRICFFYIFSAIFTNCCRCIMAFAVPTMLIFENLSVSAASCFKIPVDTDMELVTIAFRRIGLDWWLYFSFIAQRSVAGGSTLIRRITTSNLEVTIIIIIKLLY